MNTFAKTLLYYSTILSAIILVVGLVTSRNNSTLLVNVFILPVVLYLLYSVFKKGESEIASQKDSAVMMTIFIFILLFIFGVYRVYVSGHAKPEIKGTPIIIKTTE